MMNSCSNCCAWLHKHGRSIGLFLLRVSLAIIFIYQGWAKLNGGMDGFTMMVTGLGFPVPAFFAWAAALSEFVGGIALLLGVGTRIFSALLAITMTVAIFAVSERGFMMAQAPLALLGSTLALLFTGPGRYTVCRCWNCRCGVACGCCPGGEAGKMGCACAGHGMEKDACCQDKPKKVDGKK